MVACPAVTGTEQRWCSAKVEVEAGERDELGLPRVIWQFWVKIYYKGNRDVVMDYLVANVDDEDLKEVAWGMGFLALIMRDAVFSIKLVSIELVSAKI